MKKLIAFLLTLIMSISLLAGITLAEDRPVLTIGDIDPDRDYDGQRMWRLVEDRLGCKIQFIPLPTDTYAAVLASGDLPDIVHPNNNLSAILEADLALDVTPYMEEYLPNLVNGPAAPTIELYKQLLTNGEGFYFFPAGIGYNGVGYSTTFNTRGYVVRWDYYKELGCPEIHSEDDYLEVLKQMQANHPVTEDGYPTYLYGTSNFKGYDTAFRSYLCVDYWAAYQYQNNMFTNEIYDGFMDPAHSQWWASAKWINKLYNAGKDNGTFDMDLFTMTSDEFAVKRQRGQYMGLHNGNGDLLKDQIKKNPDSISGYCTIPCDASVYYTNVYQLMGNGSAYMGFISKNSPRKELALQFFNLMFDPDFLREVYLGEKGVTWDYDENGKPYMTEFGIAEIEKGTKAEGDYFYNYNEYPNNTLGLRDNMPHPVDGEPLKFYGNDRQYAIEHVTDNVAKDMCAYYEVELPTDAFYKKGGMDFRNDCGEAISALMTGLDADQLRIIASAQDVLESHQAELWMAETEDEFNSIQKNMLEEIESYGEPEVFKAYQEQWDAVAKIMGPLVQEAQAINGREPYTEADYSSYIK